MHSQVIQAVQAKSWRSINIIVISVWFGVLAGLLEYLKRSYTGGWYIDGMIYFDDQSSWLMPAGSALFFLGIGVLLALLHRVVPRIISQRAIVVVLFFLTFLNVLLTKKDIHIAASALLSIGLASVAVRLVFAGPATVAGWVSQPIVYLLGLRRKHPTQGASVEANPELTVSRRQLLAMSSLCIGGPATVLTARQWLSEEKQQRTGASKSQLPNVLLLVLDTVRSSNLSLQGYSRPTTPNLERLASKGVCFDFAIAGAPWTLPSHACMFTGRYPPELSCSWARRLNAKHPTLAERMAELGYATAGFVANTVYCAGPFGLSRGFDYYEDQFFDVEFVSQYSTLLRTVTNSGLFAAATGAHDLFARADAARINRRFLNWLDHNPRRPFFAFLNYFDAHGPYLPPDPYDSLFGARRRRADVPWEKRTPPQDGHLLTEKQLALEINQYDGSIAYLDQQIGDLIDTLEHRGEMENTIIIITSDHGEEFAEHGVLGHGNSLYLPSLHVPLIMVHPNRIPSGRRVKTPVSLRDIGATILQLVGKHDPTLFPGKSLSTSWASMTETNHEPLLSFVEHAAGHPSWYPISQGDMRSGCIGHFHYIWNGDDSEELYNIVEDPLESRNLINTQGGKTIANDCREHIVNHQLRVG